MTSRNNVPVKIGFAVSDIVTYQSFLREQLLDLQQNEFKPTVFAGGCETESRNETDSISVIHIPFQREISPWADIQALCRLLLCPEFRNLQILNASTPKAGLLGMFASWLCRIPVRIYLVRGLRYETAQGWKRRLLLGSEWLACHCATRVLCVSQSVQQELIREGVLSKKGSEVVGMGSSNGVNFARFSQPAQSSVQALRSRYEIDEHDPVIGFVGRLTRDKGIEPLWRAFQQVLSQFSNARLLIVGDFESGDPVMAAVQQELTAHPRVTITGFTNDTAPYYQLMSALAFPSYREGFPNVPLEAACAGVPTVGFASTGTVDAVIEGQTGSLVPPGDVAGLAKKLCEYLASDKLRRTHGDAARERARVGFNPQQLWQRLRTFYRNEAGLKDEASDPIAKQSSRAA